MSLVSETRKGTDPFISGTELLREFGKGTDPSIALPLHFDGSLSLRPGLD